MITKYDTSGDISEDICARRLPGRRRPESITLRLLLVSKHNGNTK